MAIILPDNWKIQEHRNDIVISAFSNKYAFTNNCEGHITIDLKTRCLRLGISSYGCTLTNKKYCGKGWKKKIVLDAIEELKKAIRN